MSLYGAYKAGRIGEKISLCPGAMCIIPPVRSPE